MHTYARFACNILRACVPPDRRAATECCKSYRTQHTLAHLRCICARVYVYVVNDACAHTHAARVCVRACVLALGFVCGFNGMHPHAHGTSESIVNAPASRTSAARVRFIIVRAEFDTSSARPSKMLCKCGSPCGRHVSHMSAPAFWHHVFCKLQLVVQRGCGRCRSSITGTFAICHTVQCFKPGQGGKARDSHAIAPKIFPQVCCALRLKSSALLRAVRSVRATLSRARSALFAAAGCSDEPTQKHTRVNTALANNIVYYLV